MNIPSLPTDNLYKFISLSGVTIVLATFLFYGTIYIDIFNRIDGMESEVSILELDSKFITEDQQQLEKKIAHLAKYFPGNIIGNIDSSITQHFVKESKELINDKNLREYYDFIFKNENKIFPEKQKIELIKSENERIISLNRIYEKKVVQIRTKSNIILRLNHRLSSVSTILGILVAIGILMALYGFKKWYNKVQKPTDEKLAIELKNLVDLQQNRKD